MDNYQIIRKVKVVGYAMSIGAFGLALTFIAIAFSTY
jgi:hypothetical protein